MDHFYELVLEWKGLQGREISLRLHLGAAIQWASGLETPGTKVDNNL